MLTCPDITLFGTQVTPVSVATVLLQEPICYSTSAMKVSTLLRVSCTHHTCSPLMYIEQEWKHFPYKHVGDYEDFGG